MTNVTPANVILSVAKNLSTMRIEYVILIVVAVALLAWLLESLYTRRKDIRKG